MAVINSVRDIACDIRKKKKTEDVYFKLEQTCVGPRYLACFVVVHCGTDLDPHLGDLHKVCAHEHHVDLGLSRLTQVRCGLRSQCHTHHTLYKDI